VHVGHITPVPLLEKVGLHEKPFHLLISSLVLEDESYRTYYRNLQENHRAWITMDSPVFETGEPVTPEQTLEAVMAFNMPNEVVLPDDLESGAHTVQLSAETVELLRRNGYRGSHIAVPHGDTIEEYLDIASQLWDIGGPRAVQRRCTLGIQEEIPELFGMSRKEFVVQHLQEALPGVSVHLLGVSETLEERDPLYQGYVRSVDTAKFVVWGLNQVYVDPFPTGTSPDYPGRKSVGGRTEYFQYDTTDFQVLSAVRWNVSEWGEG
jgi:hypothetical protein